MKIIAIDPGLHRSGYALLEGEKLITSGISKIPAHLHGDDALSMRALTASRVFSFLSFQWLEEGVDLLVVEDQYLDKNYKAASMVSTVAGIWMGAVRANRILRVYPAVWGASWRLPKKRKERKLASLNIARMLLPGHVWEEDEADAFLIGLHATKTNQMGTI